MQTLTTLLQNSPDYQRSIAIFCLYMSLIGAIVMTLIIIDAIKKGLKMENFTKTLECREENMQCSEKCKTCTVDCNSILDPKSDIAKAYVESSKHRGVENLNKHIHVGVKGE